MGSESEILSDEAASRRRRRPLDRARVLAAAMAVADRDGIAAVTMREVADRLGVEAMALYRHVTNKNELLEGLVGVVVAEINDACAELPRMRDAAGWQATVRRQILTARSIILRHPWAPALISTRGTLGEAFLEYFETLGAAMVDGGCSIDLVHHGLHVLGSRAIGYSSELFDPSGPPELDAAAALQMVAAMSERFPTIGRVVASLAHDAASTTGWCDDQFEFELGVDIILEGLESRRRDSPESS